MRNYNFSRQSAAFAATAERQFAQLHQALRALRDNNNGLRGALKAPVPQGGRRYTKTARTNPSLFVRAGENAVGNAFAGDLLGAAGLGSGSFYASAAQLSSVWTDAAQLAGRIS